MEWVDDGGSVTIACVTFTNRYARLPYTATIKISEEDNDGTMVKNIPCAYAIATNLGDGWIEMIRGAGRGGIARMSLPKAQLLTVPLT